MTKEKALEKITKEIEGCVACKIGTTGKAVPGEGNPNAKIFFVGEAPGKKEAETGRPFVGRSGQLLRHEIQAIGLAESDVFITSVGKYQPVQGTPSAAQIAHGRSHLQSQIAIIHPKVIVLLGSVAAQGVLGEKVSVMSLHGTTQKKNDIWYFLTIHPAAALRFPKLKLLVSEDFLTLQAFLTHKGFL